MANISKPAGLSPVRYLNGAKYDGKGQIYSILAADTNPYYVGDLVKLVGGGTSAAGDAQGIPAVTLSSAGNGGIGAIVAIGTNRFGSYANPNDLSKNFRPTGAQSVNYYALVSDDPNIIYEIQEGGAGTNLTTAACSRNANIVYAAPATGVYVSGTQLNNATVATTATLDLRILRLAPRYQTDNQFFTTPSTGGAGQKWWVMIQAHQLLSRPAAP